MTELYDDLGVAPDASPEALKRAHRKAVKRTHPDNSETGDRVAFDKVQRAWIILSDPDKRARYDRGEPVDEQRPGGGNDPVVALLVQYFMHAIADCDPVHDDLVAKTRELIEVGAEMGARQRADLQARLEKLQAITERLTAAGEQTILLQVSQAQVGEVNRAIAATEEKIAAHKAAAELCDAFAYRTDPRPPRAATFTTAWIDDADIVADLHERILRASREPRRRRSGLFDDLGS